ncbi:CHAP domain-containing protein [Cellulomonas soli]|uniref:Endolysin n=1 Tax=Cellulomonas soli TaxID=931535 RepID=A0A512PAU3_9CELL|nr:CHAP domain-containing protein [Cellulomonas soli]NYI57389.1 hypothetical protein [Cellulomonas soli]GEP68331.1 endolysin [Cellulomonas soli]
MTATADAVIGAAASQIGYFAAPGTPSRFGTWYGDPRGPWCAMFVSWVADQAGARDIIPHHAYTPAGAQWFRTHGGWHAGLGGVDRGDVVYFDFPGRPDRISHVALVEQVGADGSVQTIEGNTSGPGGDQRNGGLCARKRRRSFIVGYGRPAYAATHGAAPAPAQARNADGSLTLVLDGQLGPATIGRWQEVMGTPIDFTISPGFSALIAADQTFLNSVVASGHVQNLTGRPALAVDGDQGPRTIQVRQFWLRNAMNPVHQQNLIGRLLDFDGIAGPQTVKVLQFALNNATTRGATYGRV